MIPFPNRPTVPQAPIQRVNEGSSNTPLPFGGTGTLRPAPIRTVFGAEQPAAGPRMFGRIGVPSSY